MEHILSSTYRRPLSNLHYLTLIASFLCVLRAKKFRKVENISKGFFDGLSFLIVDFCEFTFLIRVGFCDWMGLNISLRVFRWIGCRTLIYVLFCLILSFIMRLVNEFLFGQTFEGFLVTFIQSLPFIEP
jgi:predicted ferric reductase